MSSSSATATASRSPSPATPESSDSALNPITIQNEDFSAWYRGLQSNQALPIDNWDDGAVVAKDEEHPMLEFDDLIDEHAYDNLPIMVPSIPEGGTKSRVETQVRVTVDLAHASASSGEPYKYDRVGSWKWLKLPAGTATKRRTRKEGKIDPVPQDMLYLTATVSCASPPHNAVLSCGSCQAREAKRVARKLAARVRPARSDSDSPEDSNPSRQGKTEDTTSIIQFNCPEVLDFTTGSVVLPLRITCYCRHHREKTGFNVHFRMMDHTGRVVGAGISRPIMITDDHKTVNANKGTSTPSGMPEQQIDWSQFGQAMEPVIADATAPSKRKQTSEGQAKKRSKPYDASTRNTSARVSREASVVSLTSPKRASPSMPTTRSPTPAHFINNMSHPVSPQLQHPAANMNGGVSPSDTMNNSAAVSSFGSTALQLEQSPSMLAQQLANTVSSPANHFSSDGAMLGPNTALVAGGMPPQPMPFMFFDPGSPPPLSALPMPKIHRLIPALGPTYGGIEVTVLGTNFHPAMTLNCVFGDVVASSTQRWSDNTLVCVLPPRASPGVVGVWFDGVQKDNDASPPCLFTYTDESDRALMELALQVVGLKMTGKIEDAKNVAMRIVGNSASDDSQSGGDSSNMMQLASASYRDIRPMLLTRAGDGEDFESVIVDFLSVLDVDVGTTSTSMSSAVSHTTASGQTLLHLAASLRFTALTRFLVEHNVDLDVRDRNGYTALHFAALVGARDCARVLVEAGADVEIVNVLGKTPKEQAAAGLFDGILTESVLSSDDDGPEDDGESQWGDGEEEEEDVPFIPGTRRGLDRSFRKTSESAHVDDDTRQSDVPANFPADEKKLPIVDEKQTASFVDMIQRTLAQLQSPQGIIPNIAQLPFLLPDIPTGAWGALQQIPVVFPIFVPTPAWPSFLAERRDSGDESKEGTGPPGASAPTYASAAQDWKATMEKWIAATLATATMRQDEAPPMYTPRPPITAESEASTSAISVPPSEPLDEEAESSSAVLTRPERPANKRPEYALTPVTDQDVNAYGYRPNKNKQRMRRKGDDRMLICFWIPILLMSLVWGLYSGAQYALQAVSTILPLNGLIQA
ncbi:hypothetical protein HWV62_28852 [Athelia sp. TMB]|nr:hypothetical protein HWV62_28852 [Athelia sp. TMB]